MDREKKITILGARGKMGSFLAKQAKKAGYKVSGFDLPLDRNKLAKELKTSFLLLLCVPIKALDSLLKEVTPFLEPPTILADICSVKVIPLQKMEESYEGPVVGTHPLFGPEINNDFTKIALCPGKQSKESAEKLAAFFKDLGFSPFFTSAQTHDLAMAYIQGLNFISTLTYFASLDKNLDMDKFMTPSFSRRKEAACKMLKEDFELFSTLFEQNPYSAKVVRTFKNYLNLAAAGELEVLVQKSWWWWQRENKGEGP